MNVRLKLNVGLTAGVIALAMVTAAAAQAPAAPAPGKAAQPASKAAREAAKNAQDAAREAAREGRAAGRDAAEQARDKAKGARREGREAGREARQDAREAASDVRKEAKDLENLRAADLGLWFTTRAGAEGGLIIADVAAQGAIAKVGFQEGDRIVSVNDERVASEEDFLLFLRADEIRNERVKVVVLRGGREQIVYVQPALLYREVVVYDPLWRYGIVIDDRYPDRIVVLRVYPRTPAYYAGLRAGDVIVGLRGQRIARVADLVNAFGSAEGRVAVQVNRANRQRELEIDTDTSIEARTSLRPNLDAETRIDGRGRVEGRENRPVLPAAEKPAPPGKPGDPQIDNPAAEKPAAKRPAPEKPAADRPEVPDLAPAVPPATPPATPPAPSLPRVP